MPRTVAGLFAVVVLLAVGCASAGDGSDHRLARPLPDEVGGYERVDGPGGPMDVEEASTAIGYVPTSDVRRQLRRTGFQEGYGRVWRRDGAFVTVLVFDFISERRAREMVAFASERIEALRGSHPFAPDQPDARGFTLNAASPTSDDPLFCQIVWFHSQTRAYEVRTCDPRPGSTDLVEDVARRTARAA